MTDHDLIRKLRARADGRDGLLSLAAYELEIANMRADALVARADKLEKALREIEERHTSWAGVPGTDAEIAHAALARVPAEPAAEKCDRCEAGRGSTPIETVEGGGQGWKCACGWWNWIAVSSVSAGAAQSPPSERAQLEWWLDRLEDPNVRIGAADRGIVAQLVRNVLTGAGTLRRGEGAESALGRSARDLSPAPPERQAGAGQVPADTIEQARKVICEAIDGMYGHVSEHGIEEFRAALTALAAGRTPEEQT